MDLPRAPGQKCDLSSHNTVWPKDTSIAAGQLIVRTSVCLVVGVCRCNAAAWMLLAQEDPRLPVVLGVFNSSTFDLALS
jgi:hypothetical protein